MRCGNRDHDARLPDPDPAHSMVDRHLAKVVLRPDVVDALDALDLEARRARALAQAGEEADGDAHDVDLARLRTLNRRCPVIAGKWSRSRRSAPPTRRCAERTWSG